MSSDETFKGDGATNESPTSEGRVGSQGSGFEVNGIQIVSLTMSYVEPKSRKKNKNTTGLMRHVRKLRLDAPSATA